MRLNKATLINSVILTGIMTLFISGVSTVKANGLAEDTMDIWLSAWLTSWLVAIPLMYFLGPAVRKLVGQLVKT